MYGVYTVHLAGKLPSVRSYTVYIYGSGRPCISCTPTVRWTEGALHFCLATKSTLHHHNDTNGWVPSVCECLYTRRLLLPHADEERDHWFKKVCCCTPLNGREHWLGGYFQQLRLLSTMQRNSADLVHCLSPCCTLARSWRKRVLIRASLVQAGLFSTSISAITAVPYCVLFCIHYA